MKKLVLLMSIIIITFSLFLYFYFRPHDYTEEYVIDDYNIVEKYLKKENVYYFVIDNKYDFIKEYKYTTSRKYIKKIETENNCLIIKLKDDSQREICNIEDYNKNIYNIVGPYIEKKYQDLTIYDINNFKFLIWDYKNILNINNTNQDKIKIFDSDAYETNLFTKINDLLIIPDLETGYEFNKIYIYNSKNNKIDSWEIEYTISNDSYILGVMDKNIYLVDNKYQKEYRINPYKKRIEIIASQNQLGTIYKNGWQDISITKLINEELKFEYLNIYHYYLENDAIYLKYLDSNIVTQVASYENIKIYQIDNADIYYFKEDILYVYNPEHGEVKLLKRFEWNFNYKNKIFIY